MPPNAHRQHPKTPARLTQLAVRLGCHGRRRRGSGCRALFVETLDYGYADLRVPLNGADANLPSDARLLARRDGMSALYIPLDGADGNRVTGAVASAAALPYGRRAASGCRLT